MSDTWPQPLKPVKGPLSAAKIDGAAKGMGSHGPTTKTLAADGFVQPDLITGMTLFLLARQRPPRPVSRTSSTESQAPSRKTTPITGGVWVREQFVIHRPLRRDDVFIVTGESTGRYVRKGRRYGTTRSWTAGEDGQPIATNLTTGLLSYHVESGLEEEVIGIPLDQTPGPEPDHAKAADNPSAELLAKASLGQVLGGYELTVALEMMAARDTATPDNAIHSDPEQARKAGLKKPIAGGNHVLSFALEPILATYGPHVLHHGAHFDVRWRAPTECDAVITPTATVTSVERSEVVFDLNVTLAEGPTAMVGVVTVPLHLSNAQ